MTPILPDIIENAAVWRDTHHGCASFTPASAFTSILAMFLIYILLALKWYRFRRLISFPPAPISFDTLYAW